MPDDVKLKPKMPDPKVRRVGAAPKEAAGILRQGYERSGDRRQPKEKNADPVQYANSKLEEYGKGGAALAARGATKRAERLGKRARQDRKPTEPKKEQETAERKPLTQEQPQQGNGQDSRRTDAARREPSASKHLAQKDVPVPEKRQSRQVNVVNASERGQTTKPSVREQQRRKAFVDAARKKAEAQGAIGATRLDGSVHAEKELRQARAGVPPKPKFALKERRLTERRIRTEPATAYQRARRAVERKLQQRMVRRNAENTERYSRQTTRWTAKAARAAVKTVKSVVSAITAIFGAGVGVVMLMTILLIGAFAASPFGILLANEATAADAVPLAAAVAQVNFDFNAHLEELQEDDYDSITVEGSTADWIEVLAVFAAKVAGSDGEDAADVVTMDADRIERLKAVFWDMTEITSEVETIDHPDSDLSDGTDDSWTERNLTITVTPRTAADMSSVYGFSSQQTEAMTELLAERAMLTELVGSLTAYSVEASEVLRRLPADLSPERRAVVETACSLVGKVTYFWGGKSLVLGWDSRWGTLQKVWADGNSTSGTYRPYGLDCSGFVDWVFYNATDGAYYPGHGGGATMQHRACSAISWSDAMPGDLVFYPGDSHVGIVGGRDEDGELLIIHCASSTNGTVVTGVRGFTSIGRPTFYGGH